MQKNPAIEVLLTWQKYIRVLDFLLHHLHFKVIVNFGVQDILKQVELFSQSSY